MQRTKRHKRLQALRSLPKLRLPRHVSYCKEMTTEKWFYQEIAIHVHNFTFVK
jgi:hypothetical protein